MTTSHAAWLRRVSDYHSGDVSGAERRAVEDHLRTCPECQEALTMYRRFYALLRSPLRLGAPSAHFDESTVPLATGPRRDTPAPRPVGGSGLPGGPSRNRRWVAGVAALVAAAVVIAGFIAIIGPRLRAPVASGTPTPRASLTPQVTAQPSATAVPSVTPTAGPDAFICANPAGSNLVYAYVRGDSNLYIVNGCSAPRQITNSPAAPSLPLSWSPSNRYLAMVANIYTPGSKVELVDAQTGAIHQTDFAADLGSSANAGDKVKVFLGWLDDATYLGGVTTIINTQGFEAPGPTTLVRVSVATGAQAVIGSIKDWANIPNYGQGVGVRIVAHGRYLFYAASDSSGTTGYLHRFDLTTGVDTRLVSLGLFTNGGCQGTPICMWTAPWDVSADGAHILYHHPGANRPPSDTGVPGDTPALYANPDGSGATPIFGSPLAIALVTPVFSPNGALALTTGSSYTATSPFTGSFQMKLATIGGGVKTLDGQYGAWRSDSAALVLFNSGQGASPPAAHLYDIQTGVTTPLEPHSNWYLWGN